MKKYIKLSELLKREVKPFVFGVFLSRIMEENIDDEHFFYAYTSFRQSKAVFECDFPLPDYAPILVEKMNWFSGHKNWCIEKVSNTVVDIRFYVLDDLKISKKAFYKILYQKMMSSDWIMEDGFTESKKSFIRGFIECRGSVDTTAKLIAQDYFYDDRTELKKALLLTDLMDLPCEYANFNARDLQPQFVAGIVKRNTQFRINAYFYANKIGFLNDYKAKVFDNSYPTRGSKIADKITYFSVEIPTPKSNSQFLSYINFFTNNIYERSLNEAAIKQLRKQLGFKNCDASAEKKKRNQTIISLYREISEDKCAICGTTKTFLNKNTGRQHFEIHHVISYANGQECDNIANLVKLCPTCHDSLKKGATSKAEQIRKIIKILNEHSEIYEFADSYFMLGDINELAEKVWEHLK
ncbi:MAG: HNH endonuclease [Clostridia bacterium]|nr:HNH endonuclease [Clostridia bacterium]